MEMGMPKLSSFYFLLLILFWLLRSIYSLIFKKATEVTTLNFNIHFILYICIINTFLSYKNKKLEDLNSLFFYDRSKKGV